MTDIAVGDIVSESAVRAWLGDLREPHRLADPAMTQLLKVCDRLPESASPLAVGRVASELLHEAIERLEPADGAGWKEQLPYLVLRTCFVDGAKLESAADKLGLSVRQLTRERSRAIALLRADLVAELQGLTGASSNYYFEPVPAISGFLPRPSVAEALKAALGKHRGVHVHGPAGIGKTSLIAELAVEASSVAPVLWYRLRTGVNDSLRALLFELAQHLRAQRHPRLAELTAASLPNVDVLLLSRVAVQELSNVRTLLVFDDYHLSELDPAIGTFLDDAVRRLPTLQLITVGRHQDPRPSCAVPMLVPGFTARETQVLLRQLVPSITPDLATSVHAWTRGIPQLTQLAGSWLTTATTDEIAGGMAVFTEQDEVQAFLLDCLTELMDSYDRDILEAASVFRHRFSDAQLAYVAQRTMGEVTDVCRHLARCHIAVRGRSGDVAFIHTSVRDYVYQRLTLPRQIQLHQRAWQWYDRNGDAEEADYHERMSRGVPEPAAPTNGTSSVSARQRKSSQRERVATG